MNFCDGAEGMSHPILMGEHHSFGATCGAARIIDLGNILIVSGRDRQYLGIRLFQGFLIIDFDGFIPACRLAGITFGFPGPENLFNPLNLPSDRIHLIFKHRIGNQYF